MKIVLSAMLLFAFTASLAQATLVTFGDLEYSSSNVNKVQPVQTSQASLLHNTKFNYKASDIAITEFVFSILPKGGNYYGPYKVKGDELTAELKAKIASFPEARIYIESIKANYQGSMKNLNPIIIDYK